MKPFKNWKTTIAGLAGIAMGIISIVKTKTVDEQSIGLIVGGAVGIFAKDDSNANRQE